MVMGLSVIKAFHIAIAKCDESVRPGDAVPAPVENAACAIYPTRMSV